MPGEIATFENTKVGDVLVSRFGDAEVLFVNEQGFLRTGILGSGERFVTWEGAWSWSYGWRHKPAPPPPVTIERWVNVYDDYVSMGHRSWRASVRCRTVTRFPVMVIHVCSNGDVETLDRDGNVLGRIEYRGGKG